MKRVMFAILLACGLATVGFALAAMLGARFGVPLDAGLAGGAIVLLYGLAGAIAGLAAACILGWRLPERRLAIGATIAVLAGGTFVGLLYWTGVSRRTEREQERFERPPTSALPEERPATRPVAPANPN